MAGQTLDALLRLWDEEAEKTLRVLRALPQDQYDFRPDPGGRSLGELAWHLAEGDAYISLLVEQGALAPDTRPPNLERPKQVEALAPGYERVHREAVARIRPLSPEHLARKIPFFTGELQSGMDILWGGLFHNTHHRGELCVLCRLAGGVAPGIYGPNREEMAAMRAQMEAAK